MAGEAGVMQGRNIIRAPLTAAGPAVSICVAWYPIDTLVEDFSIFARTRRNTYVIDAQSFPENTDLITIGVWGVPDQNQPMFTYNNLDVRDDMIYKAPGEPPIWIYAKPV